jgi:DNA repair protein RecN (Recombination protein N)
MAQLTNLFIQHFFLFEKVAIAPQKGLNIITGESGAGKTLFLDSIALLMGGRLDAKLAAGLKQKAVLEATYDCAGNIAIMQILNNNDLDEEPQLIIRREIMPNGKNRCFVNDTPVSVQVLKDLSLLLTEIHSQHETGFIKEKNYQLNLLDNYAQSIPLRNQFAAQKSTCDALSNQLLSLQNQKNNALKEQDYLSYLLQEIQVLNLQHEDEETLLEQEFSALSNANEIESLSQAIYYGIIESEQSMDSTLSDLQHMLKQLSSLTPIFKDEFERLQSARLELKEVANDVQSKADKIQGNPEKLAEISEKLSQIQHVKYKHQLNSVAEIMALQTKLTTQLDGFESIESSIIETQEKLSVAEKELGVLAENLAKIRAKAAPKLAGEIMDMLKKLEIPHANFEVQLTMQDREQWNAMGCQNLQFLFSANPGIKPQDIAAVASGGELSRLMLCFKSLGGNTQMLSIFDEIDTGVSGEVAMKMGAMIHSMATQNQLLVITHLPQVASKAHAHFLIKKNVDANPIHSEILPLDNNAKVMEIARLLSGKNPGEKAVLNAQELLGLN